MFAQMFEQVRDDLDEALCAYYPIQGDNDVPEAMPVTYLGYRLRDVGFFTYPLIQWKDFLEQHVDLVDICFKSRLAVVTEGKRLYSSEKARSLGEDWQRLQTMKLPSQWGAIPVGCACYACLLATTWKESYRDWWEAKNRPQAPGRSNESDWVNLKAALDVATAVKALHVPLASRSWQSKLYLLAALIPMPNGCWKG